FVLIGTMNPDEGELRPQSLDRFGRTVEVAAPRDAYERTEVVKRRLAFDRDPEAFIESYAADEAELTSRIQSAQKLIEQFELSEWALGKIAQVCAAFDVDGMRADIVTARAAAARAAWNGRLEVMREDIRAAARLALPHRRRRNPFDAPGIDEDLLDQILNDDEPDPPDETPSGTDSPDDGDTQSDDGQDASDPGDSSPGDSEPGDQRQDDAGQAGHASAPDSTRDAESGDGETEAGSPQKPSEQHAGSQETGSTDTSVVQSLDPYRARVFTVRGTGMGDAGRR